MLRSLTTERTAYVILWLLVLAMATRIAIDTDVWWHLRSGQYMLQTRQFIYNDPFSHTFFGVARVDYSWLAQLILYGIWSVGGMAGLSLYTALLATLGLLLTDARCTGGVYLRAFLIVLAAATAAVFWSPRPQMLSFVLTALLLLVLHRYQHGRAHHLWWALPVMLLWANMHAAYIMGLLVLGLTLAGHILNRLTGAGGDVSLSWPQIRHLALVSLLALLAVLINPNGYRLLLVPLQTVSIGALQAFIAEWQAPNFHQPDIWPFAVMLVLLLVALSWGRRPFDWVDYLLLAMGVYLALTAVRSISLFALIATPILSQHLHAGLERAGLRLRTVGQVRLRIAWLNTGLVVMVVLAVAAKMGLALDRQATESALAERLPVAAVDAIQTAQLSGPMFNSYNWGGYLMFTLPQIPVYIDGRTDLYREFVADYVAVASGSADWRVAFDRDAIQFALIESDSGLADALRAAPDWEATYDDGLAAVFERVSVDD